MLIQKRYPELSKFIGEMPVTIPETAHPQITKTNLLDYYDLPLILSFAYFVMRNSALHIAFKAGYFGVAFF
jgi:hypothetical protein